MSNTSPKYPSKIVFDEVVVKTAKRSFGYRSKSIKSGKSSTQPTASTSQTAITRKLLDGAILGAKNAVLSSSRPPALNRSRWVWRLAGSYHLCKQTEQLMKEAARRFSLEERWSLAQWAAQKAKEERGHDRLALLDIQSMGYDAKAVVKILVPPAAKALINYFTQSVQASDPIACVGYTYAMERLATGIGEKYIKKVEALLPPNTNATRCLRVHSSVGADADHVEETVEMVANLTTEERTSVVKASYETALLCFRPPLSGYVSDRELLHTLKMQKLHQC
jgi:pyrroloquinoline quinone (PQQ) biosynthesis protein C